MDLMTTIEAQVRTNAEIDALLDRMETLPAAQQEAFLRRINERAMRDGGAPIFEEELIQAIRAEAEARGQ